ncbi:MAG: cysteine protease StiP family protein [Ruminococcus sp.]|nr:cysteine protease StiP family protein [Ruminococcus sp.]
MISSYKPCDVTLLLKDITGQIEPLDSSVREQLIQSGISYCEMLPREYLPSEKYLSAYKDALYRFADITASAVAKVADKIYYDRGKSPVIVSLARGGTPVGILIKRFIEKKYSVKVPHYSISIIRGRGIDKNALKYIISRHESDCIQFVDGWTGKGTIQRQLNNDMKDFPEINPGIAVLSDPAHVAEKCGTHEDFLIANSCLNATVSGLISRTFLRGDIIGTDDFHGAMYYKEFEPYDLTYEFINTIEKRFIFENSSCRSDKQVEHGIGYAETHRIAKHFLIDDINLIKPGIGETTRVLLRRIPYKVLVYSLKDYENLGHIYRLASEKGVAVEEYPLENYKACGIIRKLADS